MQGKTKTSTLVLKVIGIIAISLGLFFIIIFSAVIGGIMKLNVRNIQKEFTEFQRKGAISCSGIIVQDSASGSGGSGTTIRYYVAETGDEYEVSYSVSNSSFPEGTHVTVYYDSADPSQAMVPELHIETFEFLEKIFVIMGVVMGGILILAGTILLIISIVQKKRGSRLNQ